MSLPKGFKRLEYIQSSGEQYVDSGVAPKSNTRVVMDIHQTGTTSIKAAFGTRDASSGTAPLAYLAWISSATSARSDYFGSSQTMTGTFDVRMVIDKNANVCTINGVSVTNTANSGQEAALTIFLFACNNRGTVNYQISAKVYSCQIYDNDTLVRDYIPCQNDSGAIGLWDAVNEVFYGNAGTGTFTAGPVVPEIVDESEITELEYIQSSGVQYVDTLFKPNQDTRAVIEGYNDSASSGWTYGTWESATVNQFAGSCNKSYAVRYGTTNATLTENIPVGPVNFDQNKNAYNVNGTTGFFTAQTFSCQYSIFLFAINAAGAVSSGKFTGKIYSCQIYDNGLLERDYVPAMLSNGEVGLYDRVFQEFYRNAGTGEFIAGPEAATTPRAPANFRVESKTDTLVTLSWDAVSDAVGYRLYRQGQLLADTTETSVSVAVEPFAGAVFTVTAYNENGEGAGSTLTHYNIPKNPLLYLITDRTQQDVAEQNPKGYYAASDLNRVGYAMDYLAGIIRGYGYRLDVVTKTDWTDEDWKLTGEMVKYLQSLNNLKAVFSTLVELPETMEKIDYRDANNIEQLLLTIDETIVRVVAGFTRANAYGLRSGAKGLPASQSDRGRNWGQLDAMETTWANWQLATWYLLLYGNLKAEGVVE